MIGQFLRCAAAAALTAVSLPTFGNTIYHDLSASDFSQNWSSTGLIATSDDWSTVPSIEGYRGDDLTAVTGTDPQTIVAFSGAPAGAVVDVNANQTNPNTFVTGGVAEFDTLADPAVALQGSGTADAPFLILYLDSTGRENVTIKYNLRDIDGSTDNAIQQVALQYRIGTSGDFTNVPAGYVADASTGPGLATLVTPISTSLTAWDNVSQLQLRIITTNAIGNDEWIGIDDISVTSAIIVPEPASAMILSWAGFALVGIRRRVAG